jgi:hypothetical protein
MISGAIRRGVVHYNNAQQFKPVKARSSDGIETPLQLRTCIPVNDYDIERSRQGSQGLVAVIYLG